MIAIHNYYFIHHIQMSIHNSNIIFNYILKFNVHFLKTFNVIYKVKFKNITIVIIKICI